MTQINGLTDKSILLKSVLEQNQLNDQGIDFREIDTLPKDQKIKQIAIQFEQMFIRTLLKNVFKDQPKDSGFSMGSGTLNDFRHSLFSQHISENGGLGYQEIIERQIREKYFEQDSDKKKTPEQLSEVNREFIRQYTGVTQSIFKKPHASGTETSNGDNSIVEQIQKGFTLNPTGMRTVRPVEAPISSEFGWRKDPFTEQRRFHGGVDFAVPMNTPVKSVLDGEVIFSGWKKGYGNIVEIRHKDGLVSKYGHNSELKVRKGEQVKRGTVVSLSGSSGRSTGPHLHFEMRHHDRAIDPMRFLP